MVKPYEGKIQLISAVTWSSYTQRDNVYGKYTIYKDECRGRNIAKI